MGWGKRIDPIFFYGQRPEMPWQPGGVRGIIVYVVVGRNGNSEKREVTEGRSVTANIEYSLILEICR